MRKHFRQLCRINGIGVASVAGAMLWFSGLFGVFLGIVSVYTTLSYSPVQFNCTLQNTACGVGSVFLTIDVITLVIDIEYVTFAKILLNSRLNCDPFYQ